MTKIEFKIEDSFYLLQYSEGYIFFDNLKEAAIEIHDNFVEDADATLLNFYYNTEDNQFSVSQISWRDIVKAYQMEEESEEPTDN